MNLLLPILWLALPIAAVAQKKEVLPAPPRRIPVLSMLPTGGILKSLMLPRYDADRKLLELLRADELKIEEAGRVSGKAISLEFFETDGTKRGRIDLRRALYDDEQGLLIGEEEVRARFERLIAIGTGLVYEVENGEGFVSGPATTTVQNPPETAMNRSSLPLRAVALLGMSALSLPAQEHAEPFASAEELAVIDRGAESMALEAAAAIASGEGAMAETMAKSDAASQAAAAFVARRSMLIATETPPAAAAVPAEPDAVEQEAAEIVAGPEHTQVTSDGGFYFNSAEGVLVYLENVKVVDPRFEMFGDVKELKVFMEKKPEEAAAADADKKKNAIAGAGAGFGDIERILANGTIRIRQKGVDAKNLIEASAAVFSYDMKTEEMILRGGKPWVKRGSSIVRALTPDQTVKISRNGDFSFSGKTETLLSLKEIERP